MTKLITSCPVCRGALRVSTLQCDACGLELRNCFEMSPFDMLNDEQSEFLIEFLRSQGNLKALQAAMGLSYQAAKKRLTELNSALGISSPPGESILPEFDISEIKISADSLRASDLVRRSLVDAGGSARVRSLRGSEYVVRIIDADRFSCNALPDNRFEVFDVIVDLLLSQGGRAKKGNGRARLGDAGCEETTVAGAIMKNYFKKQAGESAFDPAFALTAILEWAGIVKNERGYVELAPEYLRRLSENDKAYDASNRHSADNLCEGAVSAHAHPEVELRQEEHSLSSAEKTVRDFDREVRENTLRAKRECGYNPTRFNQMLAQYGAVETAKILISSAQKTGKLSDGYATLYMAGRLDLSIESTVCKPEYSALFTPEEVAYCRQLLENN